MASVTIASVLTAVVSMAIAFGHAFPYPGIDEVTQASFYAGAGNGHNVDYYAHPKYQFYYRVNDPHTGDIKNQWEERDGDNVKGSYSFNEADGTVRTVQYTVDKHSGFNAVVHRTGVAQHSPPAYKH